MNVALSKIAIVASDRELAESLSAHFRAPRTYVSVIEAPKVRLEEYGVFERDCIHVTNAIKAQPPQLALLVSCSNKVTEKLRGHLPPTDVIDIKELRPYRDRTTRWISKTFHRRRGQLSKAASSSSAHRRGRKGDRMALIIARDHAAACGADVVLLPEVSEEQAEAIDDQLRA